MLDKQDILNTLPSYTGTAGYHRTTPLRGVVCTDGARYLAESCEAFWLLDAIASYQLDQGVMEEEFQVWKLTVKDGSATLVGEDGNGREIARQDIPVTNFPLPEITLWVEVGGLGPDGEIVRVILLPSEH